MYQILHIYLNKYELTILLYYSVRLRVPASLGYCILAKFLKCLAMSVDNITLVIFSFVKSGFELLDTISYLGLFLQRLKKVLECILSRTASF